MSEPSSTRFLARLNAELAAGEAASVDPLNANLPPLARRITTLRSPWFARYCKVCGDKLREGDRVRLCPDCGEPYHDDPRFGLFCWQRQFSTGCTCNPGGEDRFSDNPEPAPPCGFPLQLDPQGTLALRETFAGAAAAPISSSDRLSSQFIAGLESVWRPFGGRRSIQVQVGSPYVGLNCPWCRFKVRIGDWVVPCPCTGTWCGTVFHQDVFRHLTCWNEWNGVAGKHYCPNTGTAYPGGD